MFHGRTLSDYYREIEAKIGNEVAGQSDKDILGLDTTEYADYLFAKYALAPVEHDESRDTHVELVREMQDCKDSFGDRRQREVVVARIEYPIIPHPTVEKVLGLLPCRIRMVSPEFELQRDRLVLHVRLPFLYMPGSSTPTGSQEINAALENLQWWLNSCNEDIQNLNPRLRAAVEQIIQGRKDYVTRTRSDFAEMVRQVSFPLKLKPSAQGTLISLPVRQELKPILKPPTPKHPEEYTLKREEVLAVIEFIKRFGQSLEATPQSVAGLDEDDIRALILAQLNGVVNGAATGESFSKLGKTDIRLNLPKGDILIAECKVWHGTKAYGKAIDQIFGYLTWRQSYAIIITFVRNKDFTNVLAQAKSAIQAHRTYRNRFHEPSEAHLVSQHVFPDDPGKSVEVHHLLFHFPSHNK
jgi:hypothetical protein